MLRARQMIPELSTEVLRSCQAPTILETIRSVHTPSRSRFPEQPFPAHRHCTACSSLSSARILHSSAITRGSSASERIKHRLQSVEEARHLLAAMGMEEKERLRQALEESHSSSSSAQGSQDAPSWRQLRYVSYQAALPFVGFGFLDNAVMILAGEYIDMTIGAVLGISTMAAAALGNLVSDLAGLGLADSVEAVCRSLGVPDPQLTISQMRRSSVHWMRRIGRCVGVSVGCLIGMAPLLWFNKTEAVEGTVGECHESPPH